MSRPFLHVLLATLTAQAACRPSLPSTDGMATLPDGPRLHYSILGTGTDTVVVLPGGPELSAQYLIESLRPVALTHALLAYDPRGRGLSDPVADSTLTATAEIADLEALRVHLGIHGWTLLAHHRGATLAALYAVRYPEHVRRMVLLAPSPPGRRQLYAISILPKDSVAYASYVRATAAGQDSTDPHEFCIRYWGFAFSPQEVTDPKQVRALAPSMCSEAPASLVRRSRAGHLVSRSLGLWDLGDTLRLVTAPVLVIEGTGPEPVVSAARTWAAWLPNGRFFSSTGPALFPWSKDPTVLDQLSIFLQGTWPDRAGHPSQDRPVSRRAQVSRPPEPAERVASASR
jgi:pimeloyl-ACP methyl ester carboxylesterase